MKYILENPQEAQRLDKQSESRQFSLETELAGLSFAKNSTALDAGCGSGVLVRHLLSHHAVKAQGCDLSHERVDYCRKTIPQAQFFQHDLSSGPTPQKYDTIFNRYVAHHIPPAVLKTVLGNLKKSLNPGGRLVMIDIDGILLNVGGSDPQLQVYLETFNKKFYGDVRAARKLPALLKECGFKNVTYQVTAVDFQDEDRATEVAQWHERMEFSLATYTEMFGSELEARRFMKLFLAEIAKADVPMFYNKFIIQAS